VAPQRFELGAGQAGQQRDERGGVQTVQGIDVRFGLLHPARLGPLAITVQEKETVTVPVIASVGSIVLGVFLLVGIGRTK